MEWFDSAGTLFGFVQWLIIENRGNVCSEGDSPREYERRYSPSGVIYLPVLKDEVRDENLIRIVDLYEDTYLSIL